MDTTRYFLDVLVVVSVPPAVVFWLLIHPLVGFWRRIGPVATATHNPLVLVSPEHDIVAVFNGWNIHGGGDRSTWRALQERILPHVNLPQ